MITVQYYLRPFKKGDETVIVELFNSTFKEYAGFVPRTPEYWVWCCLQRPDVTEEGIQIVNTKNKIVGYIVAGKTGNIWEMCYDPSYDGEIIITKLLTWAIDYLNKSDSDSVLLNFPTKDQTVRKVCSNLGFAESTPEYMFISVLDFPRLTSEVLKNNLKKQNIKGQFQFQLRNVPESADNTFCIEIKDNQVNVTYNKVNKPEVTIDADGATFASCILQGEGVLRNIVTLKIKFYPIWKISKVIIILNLLKNNSPWFMPRADNG